MLGDTPINHFLYLPWKIILAVVLIVGLTIGGIISVRMAAGPVLDLLDDRQGTSAAHTGVEDRGYVSIEPEATPTTSSLEEVQAEKEANADETPTEPTDSPEPEEVAAVDPLLTLKSGVYLRKGPGGQYDVLGSEAPGFEAPVVGRSGDGEWYQIKYGADIRVWVSALFSSLNVSPSSVPVVAAPAPPTDTAVPEAALIPVTTPTALVSGLITQSSGVITGKTFSVEGAFKPGSSNPNFLSGESIYVNMRIMNSSSSEVSFGAWGVYSDLYPNFNYIFNGDGDSDKIGANTEYSWRDSIEIVSPGTHQLQMGICLANAAYCLETKPPASDWYIISDPIQVSVTTARMSPMAPSGIPIAGTFFSVEKECHSGVSCAPSYSANEKIWVNMRIHNQTSEDQSFGAWGVLADPYIYRFFNGEGDADKVKGGTEYNWRDHIEIPAVGTYDLKMVICLAGSGTCQDSMPPAEYWHILSDSVPITVR